MFADIFTEIVAIPLKRDRQFVFSSTKHLAVKVKFDF
jgi:hypothetical protein